MAITIKHDGEVHTVAEWAEIIGIPRKTMWTRYKRFEIGECSEESLFHRGNGWEKRKKKVTYKGVTDYTTNWAKKLGITLEAFLARHKKFLAGKITEDAVFRKGMASHLEYSDANVATHNGVTHTCSEWARILGVGNTTMLNRLVKFRQGKMSEERCFATGKLEAYNLRSVKIGGKTYTCEGLARKLGISVVAVYGRLQLLKKGLIDIDKLMTKGNIDVRDREFVKNKRFSLEDGSRVSSCDLAKRAEVSRSIIKGMLDSGKSADEILEWIKDQNRHVHGNCWVNGKKERIEDVVAHLGLTKYTVLARLRNGWSLKDAISEGKVSIDESARRGRSARVRNLRLAELRKMGVIV